MTKNKELRDHQIIIAAVLAAMLFMLVVIGVLWYARHAARNPCTQSHTTVCHQKAVPHTKGTSQ